VNEAVAEMALGCNPDTLHTVPLHRSLVFAWDSWAQQTSAGLLGERARCSYCGRVMRQAVD
jgi:hypothetical protein